MQIFFEDCIILLRYSLMFKYFHSVNFYVLVIIHDMDIGKFYFFENFLNIFLKILLKMF